MDHQITIRIPAQLMDILLEVARVEDRSLNKAITLLLRFGAWEWLDQKRNMPTIGEVVEKTFGLSHPRMKEISDEQE
jgi:hypothetical protein